MADYIKIVPERLKEEASTVRICRNQHDDIISRLNNLILTLGDEWNGEAQAAFLIKYKDMQVKFRQFSEMLGVFAEDMETFAAKMQETDWSLAAQIRNLL